MQKNALAGVFVAALLSASAFAADMPLRQGVYPPPPLPPPALWTGFYAGANIGGGWTANSVNNANLTPYTDPLAGGLWLLPGSSNGGSNAAGVVGGGQIGYNWEFRQTLFGAEADIQGSTMQSGGNAVWALYPSPVTPGGVLAPLAPSGNIGIALDWFGTVRGRAGVLVTPAFLVYGTAGFAYGGLQGQYTGHSSVRTGWTAGGGVEYLFRPGWSGKAEYLFMDLDSGGTTGAFGYNWGYRRHPQINILRLGVNYHFNLGGGGEPIMAAY